MRFVRYALAAAATVALLGCLEPAGEWSEVSASKLEGRLAIGTPGLALLIGPTRKISFRFGPIGSEFAPLTPDSEADRQHLIKDGLGPWRLTKGNTTLLIPGNLIGLAAPRELYENTDTEVWDLLVSPGCSTLEGSLEDSVSGGVIVQRRYLLCGVAAAADRLRAAASR